MPSKTDKRKTRRHTRHNRESNVSLLEDVEPEIQIVVPPEQIKDLTTQQLDEEKTIALDAMNPNLPEGLVIYHCSKGEYVDDERELSHLMIHFSLESQIKQKIVETEVEVEVAEGDGEEEGDIMEKTEEEVQEVADVVTVETTETSEEDKPKVKLRNQFKYSERGCQTFNQPTRDRGVSTIPPQVSHFSCNVNRWKIYDAYVMEYMIMLEGENKTDKNKSTLWKNENPSALRLLHSDELRESVKQMEYVAHHNSENDVYNDLKFWEGDAKKLELNHLWRVKSTERRCITSIIFNKQYTNMFAIGMGSYEFNRPKSGIISIYSLKNPINPEFSFETKSGVMCMDFSTVHPALLCVGFYNGSVGVYDIRNTGDPCLYSIDNPEEYHNDPVWEVRWGDDEGDMSFMSISSDGTIVNWVLSKNELNKEVLMNLKRSDNVDNKEGLLRTSQATTFDINPNNPTQCLVGTEFGEIYCYNLQQKTELPTEYEGHNMQVYAIHWSPFDPSTFLSCSEDWTVKLWNVEQTTPIITYDLVAPVGDISWSQFSSTLFQAVTYDNKIHVFDIAVNKNDAAIHHNTNSKKYSLTKIVCAADAPIIITGNKFGIFDILKIPQLLTKCNEDREEEAKKLAAVLKITGTNVLDLKEINQQPMEQNL